MEPGVAPDGAGLRRTGRRLGLFGLYSRLKKSRDSRILAECIGEPFFGPGSGMRCATAKAIHRFLDIREIAGLSHWEPPDSDQ